VPLQEVLASYKEQLVDDAIVHRHLSALYTTLVEQNLVRLIEPYSRVEIAHIAKLINLPVDAVERQLSQVGWQDDANLLHHPMHALSEDVGVLHAPRTTAPSCAVLY
jgi:hypothetical protein